MSNEAFQRAEEIAELAANAVEMAIELLGHAEAVISTEGKKHDVPSPAQHTAVRYVQVANELEQLWEEIMGKPRVQVISSSGVLVRRISSGVVTEIAAN